MKDIDIKISEYDYNLPEDKIAKFPLKERDSSKLLVWNREGMSSKKFSDIPDAIPEGSLILFNNTKVIHARIIMRKASGARIEIFCLEPFLPSDHERAFAVKGETRWKCIVGNSKKWKEGELEISFDYKGSNHSLKAASDKKEGSEQIIRFSWDADISFGQLLELLGKIPIPPYLGRESEEIDNTRYQTVYSKLDGSVAAPTAGLHFTKNILENFEQKKITTAEITLHVGAGTFLPVKSESVKDHHMHIEHFEISADTIFKIISNSEKLAAVGTTTVRTIESLTGFGYRILKTGDPAASVPLGQWELYDIPDQYTGKELLIILYNYMQNKNLSKLKAATSIMIVPGYTFRLIDILITNFHQPKSTLLLLVSAFTEYKWREIYEYALSNDYRFLSYGDSSILLR